MNLFNKFLVILIALAGIVFWLTAIFVVWALPGELVFALRDTSSFIRNNLLLFQGLITAFGVSSILIALLVLAGEFSSQEPSYVRLAQVTGGAAAVSVEAIAQRIKDEVERMPQVRVARPRIRNLRNAIEVLVDLRTEPEVHLPTQAEAVCQAVRRTVEERLGVRLKEVRVNIQPGTHAQPASAVPPRASGEAPSGAILVPGALASQEPPAHPEETAGPTRS